MKDDFETKIELMTDFAVDDKKKSINVLIKHDYYSSDNENGKKLLDRVLDGLLLCADTINKLIIVDKAVNLLISSEALNRLMNEVGLCLICKDSIDFYGSGIPIMTNDKTKLVSMEDITDIIIQDPPNLIIE